MLQSPSNFTTVVPHDKVESLIKNDKNYIPKIRKTILEKLPVLIKELEIRYRSVKDSTSPLFAAQHGTIFDTHPGVSALPEDVINAVTVTHTENSITVNWQPVAEYLAQENDKNSQKKFDKIDQFIRENIELPKTHLVEGHNSTSNGRVSKNNETALSLSASGRGI